MRRFQRYQLDVRMVVHVFRAGVNSTIWGRSITIGQEGIGATLTGELDIGEVVGLEFTLPLNRQSTRLRAIVRYKHGLQCGLEFLAMNASQREALRRVFEILPLST
jgi:hypothetical protein